MILDSSTLVLVGVWNGAILSPDWIAREVLGIAQGEAASVQVSFPFGVGMPPAYKLDQVTYQILPDRVLLVPASWADEDLSKVESIAGGIASKLPYTPLVGLGQNFDLRMLDPGLQLLEKFAVDDAIATSLDEVPTVVTTQIVKSFQFEGCVLNLTEALTSEGHLQLKFNFHYNLKSASDVAGILTGESFKKNKSRTLEVLSKTFEIDASDIEETNQNENQLPQTTAQQPS